MDLSIIVKALSVSLSLSVCLSVSLSLSHSCSPPLSLFLSLPFVYHSSVTVCQRSLLRIHCLATCPSAWPKWFVTRHHLVCASLLVVMATTLFFSLFIFIVKSVCTYSGHCVRQPHLLITATYFKLQVTKLHTLHTQPHLSITARLSMKTIKIGPLENF